MRKRWPAVLCVCIAMLTGCSSEIRSRAEDVRSAVESFFDDADSGSGHRGLSREAYLSGTQDEQADAMMGEIVSAMDSRDAGALKSLFSDYAMGVTPDLDRQIEGLLRFYEGTSVSYDGKSDYADGQTSYQPESGRPSWGHAYELVGGHYTLITTAETYQVKIDFYTLDEEEPEKVGLSLLEVVTQDYYDQDWFVMQPPDADPGIYVQA